MWQKQQQVGSHMAWKNEKLEGDARESAETKITIIYNLRKAYQTKDIQPWSESLKRVQVWVIEKSYSCALAHCSCKNTVEKFDGHVHDKGSLGQICFRPELYQRSIKLAVTVLVSVRAGYVELTAGQFRSPGQKIS